MLRHPLRLFAASLVALMLAGCQVSGGPVDRPITATVTAQDATSPSPLLSNRTIQAGETLYYRVDVPVARDLLYGEADGSGLRVRWWTTGGNSLAVSESPAYFAGSAGALAAAGADGDVLEPSAIAVAYSCLGPCVAIAPSASTYILSVQNTTGGSRTFDLYAYTFAANDLNDRGSASNQTPSTAVTFSGTEALAGAIELVGDRDWFAYTGSAARSLQFSVSDPALGLRLQFEDGRQVSPGQSQTLSPDDRFYVYSATGRAGPSGSSAYTIQFGEPVDPGPPIAATVAAQDSTSPSAVLSSRTIQAGQTLYYRVNVPVARDLLYGEADGSGLRVAWWTTGGTLLAVSESPAYFAGSVGALAAAGADGDVLDPSSIDVDYVCLGPCAAIDPSASTYILSVHNTTGGSRTFDLYAYTFAANDFNDRGSASNQTAGTAVSFSGAGTLSGAIELIGDRDWFAYTGSTTRNLEFSPRDARLGLRLRLEDGTEISSGSLPGGLLPDERFQVYSVLGRAGPSGTAGYVIQIGN